MSDGKMPINSDEKTMRDAARRADAPAKVGTDSGSNAGTNAPQTGTGTGGNPPKSK